MALVSRKGRYLGEKEGFGIVYIGTIYYAWQEPVPDGVPMALHSWVQAKHHLEKYVAASGVAFALGGSESILLICFVSASRLKGACFDDFTMSVLHLSSYSNRARHELYISLGLCVA